MVIRWVGAYIFRTKSGHTQNLGKAYIKYKFFNHSSKSRSNRRAEKVQSAAFKYDC